MSCSVIGSNPAWRSSGRWARACLHGWWSGRGSSRVSLRRSSACSCSVVVMIVRWRWVSCLSIVSRLCRAVPMEVMMLMVGRFGACRRRRSNLASVVLMVVLHWFLMLLSIVLGHRQWRWRAVPGWLVVSHRGHALSSGTLVSMLCGTGVSGFTIWKWAILYLSFT